MNIQFSLSITIHSFQSWFWEFCSTTKWYPFCFCVWKYTDVFRWDYRLITLDWSLSVAKALFLWLGKIDPLCDLKLEAIWGRYCPAAVCISLSFFLISLRQERRIINLKVALKNIVDKNYKGSAGFARTFCPTRVAYCHCFVKRKTNTEQFLSFSCQMKENSQSCSTVLTKVQPETTTWTYGKLQRLRNWWKDKPRRETNLKKPDQLQT